MTPRNHSKIVPRCGAPEISAFNGPCIPSTIRARDLLLHCLWGVPLPRESTDIDRQRSSALVVRYG